MAVNVLKYKNKKEQFVIHFIDKCFTHLQHLIAYRNKLNRNALSPATILFSYNYKLDTESIAELTSI